MSDLSALQTAFVTDFNPLFEAPPSSSPEAQAAQRIDGYLAQVIDPQLKALQSLLQHLANTAGSQAPSPSVKGDTNKVDAARKENNDPTQLTPDQIKFIEKNVPEMCKESETYYANNHFHVCAWKDRMDRFAFHDIEQMVQEVQKAVGAPLSNDDIANIIKQYNRDLSSNEIAFYNDMHYGKGTGNDKFKMGDGANGYFQKYIVDEYVKIIKEKQVVPVDQQLIDQYAAKNGIDPSELKEAVLARQGIMGTGTPTTEDQIKQLAEKIKANQINPDSYVNSPLVQSAVKKASQATGVPESKLLDVIRATVTPTKLPLSTRPDPYDIQNTIMNMAYDLQAGKTVTYTAAMFREDALGNLIRS